MRNLAPFIQIGRWKEVELRAPTQRYEGWFEVELIHKRTGLIAHHQRFRNLVVNGGLDYIGGGTINRISDLLVYCAVGTSSTAPANAQTALVAETVRTNSNGGFADTSGNDAGNAYVWFRRTWQFTTAQANANLTEVGLFNNSSGGTMWCRSLLKDALGNPTTITKTSDYELRITYEFRNYIEYADVTYNAMVNGVSTSILMRPYMYPSWWYAVRTPYPISQMYVYTGLIGSPGGTPAGTSYAASSSVLAAYTNSNYYRECTYTWVSSNANAALRSFANGLEGGGTVQADMVKTQHQLPAALTKTNTQKLDITLRHTWARYP